MPKRAKGADTWRSVVSGATNRLGAPRLFKYSLLLFVAAVFVIAYHYQLSHIAKRGSAIRRVCRSLRYVACRATGETECRASGTVGNPLHTAVDYIPGCYKAALHEIIDAMYIGLGLWRELDALNGGASQ